MRRGRAGTTSLPEKCLRFVEVPEPVSCLGVTLCRHSAGTPCAGKSVEGATALRATHPHHPLYLFTRESMLKPPYVRLASSVPCVVLLPTPAQPTQAWLSQLWWRVSREPCTGRQPPSLPWQAPHWRHPHPVHRRCWTSCTMRCCWQCLSTRCVPLLPHAKAQAERCLAAPPAAQKSYRRKRIRQMAPEKQLDNKQHMYPCPK